MSNERSRDFGGAPSQGSDQSGADRRDAGADKWLELAQLIGRNDPFAPEASKADTHPSDSRPPDSRLSDSRLADVSRAAASLADAARDPFTRAQDRPYDARFEGRPAPDRNASGRRDPDFGAGLTATLGQAGAEPSQKPRAGGFDFPAPPARGDYPVAPRHAAVDADEDDVGGRRGGPAYRRRRDEFAEEYAEGDEYGEPDEDLPAPQRRPAKVIMAVLGLAVMGTAAAYGYRILVDAPPSGLPPIIRADNSPSRMTPMSDVKPDSGRTGDRIGGERMLRRDEDPINIATSPDVIPAAAGPTVSPGDPKRVHTVPIRADQGTAASPDRGAAPRSAAAQAVAQAPLQAQPPSPPRQVAAVQPPPPPPPQQRQAAVAAVSPPSDAPAAASAESGGYVVQLSAVRSEADAQTAFRQMQTKYPVLSGRQPLIRRKDQGERGIFFAAQIGPFGAKSEADQLCAELKAAGGSCFVQRN